ncbi:MAG: phosphatase PAP2 family protein [Chloroflexi bacterium]|nr:phosphatase PAP2 family protein [Chloroflexota bacterium]
MYLLLALGLIVLFGLLTLVVVTTPVLTVDVAIERAVQSFHPAALDTLTADVSWVGFPPQSTIIDVLIVLCIFLAGRRWAAVCGVLAAAGSAGLWFLIAPLIHRPRPSADLVRVAIDIPFGSFPSGHVLSFTAFFGFLAFLALRLLRPGLGRSLAVGVCGVLIVGIGFARIYSGEHWPSDVLAGYMLGGVWLLLCIALYRWGADRWAHHRAHVGERLGVETVQT